MPKIRFGRMGLLALLLVFAVLLLPMGNTVLAATGNGAIDSTVKIDHSTTNGPSLATEDYYSVSITSIGDLDGDGVLDLAAGAYADDNGGTDRAVHIHFMNTNGSIDTTVEINSSTTNGPTLSNEDYYGVAVTDIGDLNSDGVRDLAVGAHGDDAGGTDRGAVHIHFMNTNGSIDSTVEINDSTANGPTLADEDYYGFSIVSMGDLNGDGVQDLAVGAPEDDTGGTISGAVHIHFMNTDGSVDSTAVINGSTTNGPSLSVYSYYGLSVAAPGDLNGDGVLDLIVGAPGSVSSVGKGEVFIHYMNTDGSIDSTVAIDGNTTNGASLSNYDLYGFAVSSIGDLNSDGVADLAVGSPGDDTGGTNRGTIYIHLMNTDGSMTSTITLDGTTANGATLADDATYGVSVASIGDLDGNGVNDLAAGIDVDGSYRGAMFIHFMHGVTTTTSANKFSEDKRCHWAKPPATTWIKLEIMTKDGVEGMLVTWSQYDANKVTIKIDDGIGSYPWKVEKTSNDGHEFLLNVQPWQNIKIKPINHCKNGDYSLPVSLSNYPEG